MNIICEVCGSEGGPRSYLHNSDILQHCTLLTWFLHLKDPTDVSKIKSVCAICIQIIKSISISLSDLRKKYIETQILLEHYVKNVVSDPWNEFQNSTNAANVINEYNCDIEDWKYSIDKFTHSHFEKEPETITVEDPQMIQITKEEVHSTSNDIASSDGKCDNMQWIEEVFKNNEEEQSAIIIIPNTEEEEEEMTETKEAEKGEPKEIEEVNEELNAKEKIIMESYINIIKEIDGVFFCGICREDFKWKYQARQHIRSKHTQEKPFKCQFCDKEFTASNRLTRHILALHETKRFVCPTCGKSFSRRYVFLTHEKTHTELPSLSCHYENCEKKFHSNESLNAHIRHCHKEKEFICDSCGSEFRTHDRLRDHRKRHDGKTVKCEVCPMMFSSKKDLYRHTKFHRNNYPWKCGACNMFFKSKRGLQNHFNNSHNNSTKDKMLLINGTIKDKKSLLPEDFVI